MSLFELELRLVVLECQFVSFLIEACFRASEASDAAASEYSFTRDFMIAPRLFLRAPAKRALILLTLTT